MTSPAGRFWMGASWAVYLGPGLVATVHAHHAAQIVVPVGDVVRLRTPGAQWASYRAAAIGADVPHESDRPVARIGSIWIEPVAGALRPGGAAASITALADTLADDLGRRFRELGADRPASSAVSALVAVACPPAPSTPDPRVLRAIELIEAGGDQGVGLEAAALAVGLSTSRLGHLFTQQVGIPFRRFVLWRRLRAAVQELAHGATAT